MKILIIFLLVSICIFSAPPKELAGEWTLIQTCGGLSGKCIQAEYSMVHYVQVTTSPDSVIINTYFRDTLRKTEKVRCIGNTIYHENGINEQIVSLSDSSLIVKELLMDGVTFYYKRRDLSLEDARSSSYGNMSIELALFPNPTTNKIASKNFFSEYLAVVIALDGKVLIRCYGRNSFGINIKGALAPGRYIVKVIEKDRCYKNIITVE